LDLLFGPLLLAPATQQVLREKVLKHVEALLHMGCVLFLGDNQWLSEMFSFADTYDWYQKNIDDTSMFRVDRTVQCWQMYRRSDWKKYRSDEVQEQFMLDRINGIRKMKHISEKYSGVFKQGMYVITDYKKNWLLFVYPELHLRTVNGRRFKILTADHFTVPYFPKHTEQIQFHQTRYVPTPIGTGERGGVMHIKNHFKDSIPYDDIPFCESLVEYQDSILDMLQPMAYEANVDGGGPGKKRAAASKSRGRTKRARRTNNFDADIASLRWTQYKIQHVMIFAKKHGRTFDCTCIVYDRKPRDDEESRLGFAFALNTVTEEALFDNVMQYVAKLLEA
jgi:hypothetical protein